MWTFLTVARIERNWGQWQALVTLERGGVPESFFINMPAEPSTQDAEVAGTELAARMNAAEAAKGV